VDDGFGLANLPYGVAISRRFDGPRAVTRLGDHVVDLAAIAEIGLLPPEPWWRTGSRNTFLAAGPAAWAEVRERLAAARSE
jgi:fumarylacetoacetase